MLIKSLKNKIEDIGFAVRFEIEYFNTRKERRKSEVEDMFDEVSGEDIEIGVSQTSV